MDVQNKTYLLVPKNIEDGIQNFETIDSIEELKRLLTDLQIRFSSKMPNNYKMEDYKLLIDILSKSLIKIYNDLEKK